MRRFLLLGVLLFNFALAQFDTTTFNDALAYELNGTVSFCDSRLLYVKDTDFDVYSSTPQTYCFDTNASLELTKLMIKSFIENYGFELKIIEPWKTAIGDHYRFVFKISKTTYALHFFEGDSYNKVVLNHAVVKP